MKKAFITACLFAPMLANAGGCEQDITYAYDTQMYVGGMFGKTSPSMTGEQGAADKAFGAFAGYRFSDKMAAEINYSRLGSYSAAAVPPAVAQVSDVTATSFSVIGKYPLDEDAIYSVYGRAGFAKVTVAINSVPAVKQITSGLTYGVGLEVVLDNESRWYGRIGVDRYNIGDVNPVVAPAVAANNHLMVPNAALLYNF